MEKEGLFLSILELLRKVPRRMLMVLKINDLTRSLDHNLHTTHGPTRPFIIAARYCALAVWDDDREKLRQRRKAEGLSFGLMRDWIGAWWNYMVSSAVVELVESKADNSSLLAVLQPRSHDLRGPERLQRSSSQDLQLLTRLCARRQCGCRTACCVRAR